MKITKTNYFKAIQKIHFENLPLVLKQAHTVIMTKTDNGDDWSLYNKDPELKRMIDLVFTKVEELIKSNRNYLTPKDAAMHLIKNPVINGEDFDDLPNKKLSVKNDDYEAHVEGYRVIVTMLYGTGIDERFDIDDLIPEILNSYLSADTRKRLAKKRGVFKHKQPEFKILSALVNWNNNTVTKAMVKTFLAEIKGFRKSNQLKSSSVVIKEIKLMEKKLNSILMTMGAAIIIQFTPETQKLLRVALKKVTDPDKENKKDKGQSLHGIQGKVVQENTPMVPQPEVISSEEFAKTEFKTIGLTGKWLMLIGDPCPGFKAAVSGLPKMGKSFLCVEFAEYLSRNHGKVLYVTKEEFMSPTFQLKLKEKNAANPNLDIAGALPADLSAYQFIFLDSVTSMKLSADDLKRIEEKNPGTSFIYVHQVTKDGKARGTNEFMHNVDIIITIPERGKAFQYGRYNQGGQLDIFSKKAETNTADNLVVSDNTSKLDGISRKKKVQKGLQGNENIEIEAEVIVPFELLAMGLFQDDETEDDQILEFIHSETSKAEQAVKDICADEISEPNVSIKKVTYNKRDSEDENGFSIFTILLAGPEDELRNTAGEGEIFIYDWSKVEQGFNNSYLKNLQSKNKN